MGITRNVYNGLDSLEDFYSQDILNEILVILTSDIDWKQSPPMGRLEFDIFDFPIKSKIKDFLIKNKIIDSEDYISIAMLWKDQNRDLETYQKQLFSLPLHIDPYKLVYKAIQVYLDDNACYGSVWFDTNVYNEVSNALSPSLPGWHDGHIVKTDIPGKYDIYSGEQLISRGSGKTITYGKNKGYMLRNSLTEPLPHAVMQSNEVRTSLYIGIVSDEYYNWVRENKSKPVGGFRVNEDL